MIGAVDVNLAISQELAQRIQFIFIRLGAHLKQIIFLVLNNEQYMEIINSNSDCGFDLLTTSPC